MYKFTKKRSGFISKVMLVIMIFSLFPALSVRADNSVDIDVTNWDDWYVYDHYDNEAGLGYITTDPSYFTANRPYYPIVENQAINNGYITTIPDLLNTASWRMVHHLKEHISLITTTIGTAPNDFDIHDIVFMGYGEEPYTDFLIYPETSGGVKSFGYDIYALNIDTHTLSSAGFLLNAGVDAGGFIHGYVLLIGFPYSSNGGSFDGARMYLYKINENVKAEDIHHPTGGWSMGAFSNQGNMQPNQLPAMDISVDGRTVVLLDTDGDGEPDHVGFRQEGSVADAVIAGIYDEEGSIIASVMVDGEDIIIDATDTMIFYENEPFSLDDSRVGLMSQPMDIDLGDPNNTINYAKVMIDGAGPFETDGDKYIISRNGVHVRSNVIADPGYNNSYWVGRPGRWNDVSFVPGHSWVSVGGTEYLLDDDAYYIEGNYLYIRDGDPVGQYESFWSGNYTIKSAGVVLNDAAPVTFDPDTMWIEQISGLGNMLCLRNPSGIISTYFMDGTHSYFTTDTQVELLYGNPEAGIVPGIYTLDGTEAYMDNGYLYVRKNIHYNYVYLDGTTNYVTVGSQFKINAGQIVEINGTSVKFESGSLVLSGPRYTYEQHYWSESTYPTELKIDVTKHGVLPDGLYIIGENEVDWDKNNGYLYAPISIYVIDGEDMFIENGKDIYVKDGKLHIFPGGIDINAPGRVEMYAESGRSEINEIIKLDDTNNYMNEDDTIHLAPRLDRYNFNYENLTQVGTLTNPGEFFAPEGKRTNVLHLDVTFTDDKLTITSKVPGGDGTTKDATITFKDSLKFQNDGEYRGFGPYVEYQSHGCSSLTSFRFSNMTMGAVPQHTLYFDLNTVDPDAEYGDIKFLEVDEGAKIGALPSGTEPTRPGYNFQGWAKKSYATTPDFDSQNERMGFENITVYAVWEAKPVEVIFYAPDGYTEYDVGIDANNDKRYGDRLTGFPAPEPWDDAGATYIFDGWYLDDSFTDDPWDFSNDVISADVTTGDQLILYAKWREVTGVLYELSFDADGGENGPTDPKQVEGGVSVGTLPSAEAGDAPTKTDADFLGWSTTLSGAVNFDENSTISADTTVYAVWQAKPIVTFDLDGGDFDDFSIIDGPQYADKGTYKIPAEEPIKDGFRFTGWKVSSTDYDPGDVIIGITGNITIEAQWEQVYTVEVFESSADVNGSGSYVEDDIVTINSGNRSSEWVFLGWEVTSGGAPYTITDPSFDINSKKTTFIMPSEDVVITAVWYELKESDYNFPAETHEVMFDANGGHPFHVEFVVDGEEVTEPSDPTRTGYRFLGWYTAETGGEEWDFNDPITESIVLYAHWEDDNPQHAESMEATVIFDYQDGSDDHRSDVVDLGQPVTEPARPVRAGATFKGWYTAPTGGSEWDFNDEITRDIKLYAHWTVEVTFVDTQSGQTAPSPVTVDAGAFVTQPANPTAWSGHTFRGWFTEQTGGLLWNFTTMPFNNDTTLYAHWTTNNTSSGPSSPETGSSVPNTPVTPVNEVVNTPAPTPDEEDENPAGTNPVNDETTNPPPTDRQQETPQNIVLPQGSALTDFPDVDLNAHQEDMTRPGGNDHHAPPVANDSHDLLVPQYDEDGNLIFVEIVDLDGIALGYWTWSEEDEMWVFVEEQPPLAQMPKTGQSEPSGRQILVILAIIAAAFVLHRSRKPKSDRV